MTDTKQSKPPFTVQRNEHGLYDHIDYVFREDGKVHWLKMISPEYFVPNRDRTNETDASKLPDEDKLILLQGFRELADLRGYRSVTHNTVHASTDLVVVETSIQWRGNYETDNEEVNFTAIADAHPMNTKSFATNYLASIAENRGFVRAVKGFLKIPVLAKDELGDPMEDESKTANSIHNALKELLDQNKIKFENFQNRMVKLEVTGAENWRSIYDIPSDEVANVISKVKEALQARAAKLKEKS